MKSEALETLWECISQELLLSEFYHLFERLFSEDSDFWRKILLEEVRHGSLLRAEIDRFCKEKLLPESSEEMGSETLNKQGAAMTRLLARLKESPPTREQAFAIALALENTTSEHTYQELATQAPSTRIQRLFQSLNQANRDHIDRIKRYATEQQIQIDGAFELEVTE